MFCHTNKNYEAKIPSVKGPQIASKPTLLISLKPNTVYYTSTSRADHLVICSKSQWFNKRNKASFFLVKEATKNQENGSENRRYVNMEVLHFRSIFLTQVSMGRGQGETPAASQWIQVYSVYRYSYCTQIGTLYYLVHAMHGNLGHILYLYVILPSSSHPQIPTDTLTSSGTAANLAQVPEPPHRLFYWKGNLEYAHHIHIHACACACAFVCTPAHSYAYIGQNWWLLWSLEWKVQKPMVRGTRGKCGHVHAPRHCLALNTHTHTQALCFS